MKKWKGDFVVKKINQPSVKPFIEEAPCVYPDTEEIKILCDNAFEEDKETITRAILYLKDH